MDILHWLCGSVTSVLYESYDSVAIKLAFQLNSNAITSFSARYTANLGHSYQLLSIFTTIHGPKSSCFSRTAHILLAI